MEGVSWGRREGPDGLEGGREGGTKGDGWKG